MVVPQVQAVVVVVQLPKIKTMPYLETTKNVYKEAAENPVVGLCAQSIASVFGAVNSKLP